MKGGDVVTMPKKRLEILQTLLWHTFSSMRGEVVVVTCASGCQYVGVLFALTDEESTGSWSIVLRHAQKHSVAAGCLEKSPLTAKSLAKLCSGEEYSDEVVIGSDDFCHLFAPKVGTDEAVIDDLGKERDLETFVFDDDIHCPKHVLEWGDDDADDDADDGLRFDQFEGKQSTYDENMYTVSLDESALGSEALADARSLAHRVQSTESHNVHVLEDRDMVATGVSQVDEESAYSAVLGSASELLPMAASKPGRTKPPMREKTAEDSFTDLGITAKLMKSGKRGNLLTLRHSESLSSEAPAASASSLPRIDEDTSTLPSLGEMPMKTQIQPKLRAMAKEFVPCEPLAEATPATATMAVDAAVVQPPYDAYQQHVAAQYAAMGGRHAAVYMPGMATMPQPAAAEMAHPYLAAYNPVAARPVLGFHPTATGMQPTQAVQFQTATGHMIPMQRPR